MGINRNNKVQILHSESSGVKPDVSQLEPGELAINTNDGVMYFKKSDGSTGSFEDETIKTVNFDNASTSGTNFTINSSSKGITFIAGEGVRFEPGEGDEVGIVSTLSFSNSGPQPTHPFTFYYNKTGDYRQGVYHGATLPKWADQEAGWMDFTSARLSDAENSDDLGGLTFTDGVMISFSTENIFGGDVSADFEKLPVPWPDIVPGSGDRGQRAYLFDGSFNWVETTRNKYGPTNIFLSQSGLSSVTYKIVRKQDNSWVSITYNPFTYWYVGYDEYTVDPFLFKTKREENNWCPPAAAGCCDQAEEFNSAKCTNENPIYVQSYDTLTLNAGFGSPNGSYGNYDKFMWLDAVNDEGCENYDCKGKGDGLGAFGPEDWCTVESSGTDYHNWSHGDTLEVYVYTTQAVNYKREPEENTDPHGIYGITSSSSPVDGECYFDFYNITSVGGKGETGTTTTIFTDFSIHKNDLVGVNHDILNLAFSTRYAGDFIFEPYGKYTRGPTGGYTAGSMIFKTSGFTTNGDYYTFTIDDTVIQNDGLSGGDRAKVYFRPSSTTRVGETGEQGPTGPTGATGADGATGATGPGVGYTSGADTPSSANTGDFWLETDTGDLFFYDGSSFVQISGADGTDGATGATGPVGDYVETFNGATGAVEGVSSVNGNTGGITAASGIRYAYTTSTSPSTGELTVAASFVVINETSAGGFGMTGAFQHFVDVGGGQLVITSLDGDRVFYAVDVSSASPVGTAWRFFRVGKDKIDTANFISGEQVSLMLHPNPESYVTSVNGATGEVTLSGVTQEQWIWCESNTGLFNGAFIFDWGNSAASTKGPPVAYDCTLTEMRFASETTTTSAGEIELYVNGSATGITMGGSSGVDNFSNLSVNYGLTAGDRIQFRSNQGTGGGKTFVSAKLEKFLPIF